MEKNCKHEYRIMLVTKVYPEHAVLYQISPISGQSKSICQNNSVSPEAELQK